MENNLSDVKHDYWDVEHDFLDVECLVLDFKRGFAGVKSRFRDVKNPVSDVGLCLWCVENDFSNLERKLLDVGRAFLDVENGFQSRASLLLDQKIFIPKGEMKIWNNKPTARAVGFYLNWLPTRQNKTGLQSFRSKPGEWRIQNF